MRAEKIGCEINNLVFYLRRQSMHMERLMVRKSTELPIKKVMRNINYYCNSYRQQTGHQTEKEIARQKRVVPHQHS